MNLASNDIGLAPWNGLQRKLAGGFSARPLGLLAAEYSLVDRNGDEFGRLTQDRSGNAEFEAGSLRTRIERHANAVYRMVSSGGEILTAAPRERSADYLRVECAGRVYEARISLLRNSTVAYSEDGVEITRLTGGFVRRGYEAAFDREAAGAMPVTIMLLYHTASARRRAYRT
jgi:hypothetical protein